MNDTAFWLPSLHSRFTLVANFADFYQEVAHIKRAQSESRLASYLSGSESAPPSEPIDFARRVNVRLAKLLKEQRQRNRADATSEVGKLEEQARYVMAALADEVLIFELDWPGRDAWLQVLLEKTMFDSSNAGSRFFSLARKLVTDNVRSPLHRDLAAVFLLALELGFKGCWRSRQGQSELAAMRHQLYQLAAPAHHHVLTDEDGLTQPTPACEQAYAFPLRGIRDERLAPISPWRNLALYGLAGYLMATVVLWLMLMYPFERYIGA